MFALVLLSALTHTLRSASHASGTNIPFPLLDVVELASREENQLKRTTYSILRTCIGTIFACVWQSAHPNMNGPTDSGWTCLKRRIFTMLCAMIFPEAVFCWALGQNLAAREIVEQYNAEFGAADMPDLSKNGLWRNIVAWFRPLSIHTTRRIRAGTWTMTHAFFLQMGGFILYDDEYPLEVLDYNRFAELLRSKAIEQPIITMREIQDRSKGDAISKSIVIFQTTWFAIQCVARVAWRLPLCELEVLTLAFVVVNIFIYAAWWSKPQGAAAAVIIQLQVSARQSSILGNTGDQSPHIVKAELGTDNAQDISHRGHGLEREGTSTSSASFIPLVRSDPTKKASWLRRQLHDGWKRFSALKFVLYFPYTVSYSVYHVFWKLAGYSNLDSRSLRVPMFYASGFNGPIYLIEVISAVIGAIFGATHFLGWESDYASEVERILWRVSSVLMVVAPILFGVNSVAQMFMPTKEARREMHFWARWLLGLYHFVYCVQIPLYVLSRFCLIVLACREIRNPSAAVLRNVSWTAYIPHF